MRRPSDPRGALHPTRFGPRARSGWPTPLLALAGLWSLAALAGCAASEPVPGALLAPSGAALYSDGEYVASYSATAGNGWQPFLVIRVRAGLITDVCYDAVAPDGALASQAEPFVERLRVETGVHLDALMDGLESALLERQQLPVRVPFLPQQDISQHDTSQHEPPALAGLEWASWFAVLAESALAGARAGASNRVTVPMPGPYVATDAPDELGWAGRLAVTFSGEEPAAATFEELRVEADGSVAVKADDAGYAARYDARIGLTPGAVGAELVARLLGAPAGGRRWQPVDAVAGASGTSARFNALAASIAGARRAAALPNRLCR